MPSVEELLSVAEADADTRSTMDSRIEIDADTRTIQMMPQDELFGVESDEKSERKYFKVHKIVGNGVDLSKLQLRINYQNASKIPSGKDMYIVQDATVYNDEWVYFSWELSRKVTQYKGNIYFIVCAIKADSNGNITNEWNTTLAEGKVLEGLEVETSQEQQYQASDYLEQLKQQLLEYSKEIKDTFPSDYTQIQDDIGSLKEDIVSFSEYKGLVHDWTTDKIIYTDSDAVDMVEHFSSSGKYAIVECTAGDIFTIYGTGFGKALLWCFVDINYNRITYSGSNATLLNDVIEAPENTSYLIVNCTKSGVICKGRYMEPIVKSIFDEKIRPTLLQETPYVSYRMFGAVLDGVTDDSEAVMMCHSYANKNGKKVVEHGGSLLCNFTVDVKTDCELNIEFIVNDVSPLTIYNIVSDDEKDIYYSNTFVSNQGTLTDAPEILGKFFVPRREASEWYLGRRYPSDSELEYYHRQPVVVDKLGNIISSRIYRETDGKCRFYSVKELAEKGIVFSAGKVTTTLSKIGFPRFVKCTRNNTVVKNIFVKNTSTPSLPTAYASGLIEVSECCNVVIENIVGLNNSVDMTNYSYIIDITDCYNITVKDCNITQSWGVMASHFCDTISIYNCIINRVDNHYGLFGNWTIRDCVTKYINLGYGDGTVNVDNVTFVNNTDSTADYAITTRADFNVFYCGNLIVNNVKFDGNINYIVKWIQGTQEEGYEANSGLQKKLAPTLRVYNTRLNANTALVANTIERNIPSYFYAVIGVPCTSTSLTDITAHNSELYKCYGKGKKAFYDCIIKTLTKLEADDGLLSLYNCNVKYNFNDESIDIDAYNTVFDITGEVNGNNITMVGCYAVGELVVNANKKKIINCANIS